MSDSGPDAKDSITEVAEESFVRERPLQIERGAVLASRYQVEEVIGKGGSGVVLRVFDRTVQNVVALKVLKSELARDAKWDKRFSRELRLGRPIQHPNVCRIFDIGEADGHRFLTMELATGGSLRDELKRRPALERPIHERLADARAAIEGLAAIHATGVVHRDFKPDNLLRMEDGRLVISDFGLATDAAAGPGVTVMIGTPHYMAPEVLAGEPATMRSDVWALGVVLHEIFFGRRPERKAVSFDGSGRGPLRPDTGLERAALSLCDRCLAEIPGDRPADARAVQVLFARVRAQPTISHRGRKRMLTVGIPAALATLGVAAVWMNTRRLNLRARQIEGAAVVRRATGSPEDWGPLTTTLATFGARVECLMAIDQRTVYAVWGNPRRATEVDVETGRTTPFRLVEEAYGSSCPDISPKTKQVLYAARNSAGTMEVRMSSRLDGSEAVVVTSGRDPRWLGSQPAFVYTVDDQHVAMFSLSTMEFSLLQVGEPGAMLAVSDQVVSPNGEMIAVTSYDERAEGWLDILFRTDGRRLGRFPVSVGSRVAFARGDTDVLVAGPNFERNLSVALLDSDSGNLSRIGHLPGMDLTRVLPVENRLLLVALRVTRDVWSYTSGRRERVTSDGDVFSAARSQSGEMLLGRRAPDGAFNVWLRAPDRTERRLTSGRKDVTPAFGPDGKVWAYADYDRSTIEICQFGGGCRALATDQGLPEFPSFSPSGERLALVTQMGRSQVKTIALDGRVLAAWDALPVCGPMWSSEDRVWSVENVHGFYFWAEHNAASGEATGNRVRFANPNAADSPIADCRAEGAEPGMPLFRPIQSEAEEQAQLRVGSYDGMVR